MEHRGVEYRIMQGIQRGLWKWSVETETGTKSGTSESKDAAMNAANARHQGCCVYRKPYPS